MSVLSDYLAELVRSQLDGCKANSIPDGVKIEELLVSSKEDAEKLGNELADKFSKELEEFVKKQQEQKKVAFGRLEEIKELLSMQ